ncbi:unnamed protein product [Ixodes hexagonus]
MCAPGFVVEAPMFATNKPTSDPETRPYTGSDVINDVNALRAQAALPRAAAVIPQLPDDCPHLPVKTTAEMTALNLYLGQQDKLLQMAEYFGQNGGENTRLQPGQSLASL